MSNLFQKISRAGLVLVLIGAALLWFSLGDAIISLKAPKSFDDVLEYGVAPGDHVKGSVPYLLDVYATLETWSENTKTHSVSNKKTSFQYYVLPAGDGYVGMAISSKNFSAADKLVDQTYDFLLDGGGIPTAELTADARVIVMEAELAQMFREDLQDYYGYTAADIEALGTPLLVEPRAFGTVQAFCGAGAAALVAGLAVLALHWRKVSRQLRQAAEASQRRGPDLDWEL